ncbi:hypothetical protein [Stutzerimonas stutzeri]|uniref:Periplasmic protein n=1 Tax=Stutzerimonas stutzeri TaxID=316 RepID=A0AA40RVK7_STUST|nr:hypothetical protein [Stutzerimonas stutzeri]MBA1306629.1 hypothetical protein [Stutzerimonas stutzeri]
MSRLFRCMLAAAALAAVPACASSAIQVVAAKAIDGRKSPPAVFLSGELSDATVTQLRALSSTGRLDGAVVYLDSAGGEPQAGMALGDIIRDRGMNTAVGRQQQGLAQPAIGRCMSACVLAYAGGTFRFIDPSSQLGIHRFYRQTPSAADLDVAQLMSAAITSYLIRMGIDPELFARMVSVERKSMELLSHSDAIRLRLVNNGVLPAEWAIEGRQGSVYLAGRQVSANGTGKLIMSCTGGRSIRLSALYDGGDNNREIARRTANYSLRINDRFVPIARVTKPATVSGQYVLASFQPDMNMLWDLSAADQIGFGFHTSDRETFYGFLVAVSGQQDLIRSWITHCTEV